MWMGKVLGGVEACVDGEGVGVVYRGMVGRVWVWVRHVGCCGSVGMCGWGGCWGSAETCVDGEGVGGVKTWWGGCGGV